MEKQHIYNFTLQHFNSNIDMIYIICLVIPTKVDTSQVPQQNVNLMPMEKAMIKTTWFRNLICTTTVGQYIFYLPMWMWSVLTGYDQKFFRPKVLKFPM